MDITYIALSCVERHLPLVSCHGYSYVYINNVITVNYVAMDYLSSYM